jgi:hypothetical protein
MEKFRRVTNMAAISVLMRDENDTVKKTTEKIQPNIFLAAISVPKST